MPVNLQLVLNTLGLLFVHTDKNLTDLRPLNSVILPRKLNGWRHVRIYTNFDLVLAWGTNSWSLYMRFIYALSPWRPKKYSQGEMLSLEWRKLHNELRDLYSIPDILQVVKSRRMRWVGQVARMGEERGVHRVLVGKPEGKGPLRRPRCRWEDNIKMGLQEVGGGCGDWMELAQDRDRWRALVNTVMNCRVR